MTQNTPATGVYKRNPPIAGEAEAIEAAKSGDAEAFSRLYALHKRRVYTLCLRMLGNVSEAEDMTQEAFLHLFRKIGSFDRTSGSRLMWVPGTNSMSSG